MRKLENYENIFLCGQHFEVLIDRVKFGKDGFNTNERVAKARMKEDWDKNRTHPKDSRTSLPPPTFVEGITMSPRARETSSRVDTSPLF